jgi:hypothetical protein
MEDRSERIVITQSEEAAEREVDDRAFADALNVREFSQPFVQIRVDVRRKFADRRRNGGLGPAARTSTLADQLSRRGLSSGYPFVSRHALIIPTTTAPIPAGQSSNYSAGKRHRSLTILGSKSPLRATRKARVLIEAPGVRTRPDWGISMDGLVPDVVLF